MTLRTPPISARTRPPGAFFVAPDLFERGRDEALEGVGRAIDLLNRSRSHRVDLDEAHARRRRLVDDQPDEGLEGLTGALLGGGMILALADDGIYCGAYECLEGCQKALFLVLEMVVEGAARDPRELEQVGDPSRLIALLGDHRDHCREESLALVARDLLGREPAAGLQLALVQRPGVPHGVLSVVAGLWPAMGVQFRGLHGPLGKNSTRHSLQRQANSAKFLDSHNVTNIEI